MENLSLKWIALLACRKLDNVPSNLPREIKNLLDIIPDKLILDLDEWPYRFTEVMESFKEDCEARAAAIGNIHLINELKTKDHKIAYATAAGAGQIAVMEHLGPQPGTAILFWSMAVHNNQVESLEYLSKLYAAELENNRYIDTIFMESLKIKNLEPEVYRLTLYFIPEDAYEAIYVDICEEIAYYDNLTALEVLMEKDQGILDDIFNEAKFYKSKKILELLEFMDKRQNAIDSWLHDILDPQEENEAF